MKEDILAYFDKKHKYSLEEFEKILKENGISIREEDEVFRDFCEVLNDIGELWNECTK